MSDLQVTALMTLIARRDATKTHPVFGSKVHRVVEFPNYHSHGRVLPTPGVSLIQKPGQVGLPGPTTEELPINPS
jgi:hypothetical protein